MHRLLNFDEIIDNQSEYVNANSRHHKSNEMFFLIHLRILEKHAFPYTW
jgi:hypothetical protein